jgi:hypothetical protein
LIWIGWVEGLGWVWGEGHQVLAGNFAAPLRSSAARDPKTARRPHKKTALPPYTRKTTPASDQGGTPREVACPAAPRLPAAGLRRLRRQTPLPHRHPQNLPPAVWQRIDQDIIEASAAAAGSANDYARRSMRVWKEQVQQRTENDFIPWFTGYWTQQWLTLRWPGTR